MERGSAGRKNNDQNGGVNADQARGAEPLAPSGEREIWWTWSTPIRTVEIGTEEALQGRRVSRNTPGRNPNLGESQVRIGDTWWRWGELPLPPNLPRKSLIFLRIN